MRTSRHQIAIVIAGGMLLPLFTLIPWYPGQLSAGLVLIAFLPGYALLLAVWPEPKDPFVSTAERILLAVGVSYGLTVTLLLLIAFVRIPLNLVSVAGSLSGVTLVCGLIAWRRWPPEILAQSRQSTLSKSALFWLILILFIAGFFRVVNIYYSDYQGDEADILLRAVSLVYGHTETLLTHSKGPAEILILAGSGVLTGRFDEQTARLPFSIAGTVSVGLIFLWGTRLFDQRVGVVAGLLAALDGVFVSYARTAQYQSVVLLLTLAALWCFYRFYAEEQSQRLHPLCVGTFLLAAAFLGHFETILLLPVVGYLTLAHLGWPQRTAIWSYITALRRLWPSLLLFGVMVGLFYLPFLLHPAVGKTGVYLENRIGGGSQPPFNNLGHFFYVEALKYNAVYYVVLFDSLLVGVGLFALVKVWQSAGQVRIMRLGIIACLISLTFGILLSFAGTERLSALLIALGLALFFALVILSPATPDPHRILWLWLAPPFWVYVFLVNRPGKHHYIFLAALTLLVGWGVGQGWLWATRHWRWLAQPAGRRVTLGVSLSLLLIFMAHTVMVLIRSDVEYVLTYPDHKSSLYPTDAAYPYNTRIGFGYPFRLGWQTLGALRRTGQLRGSWGGNDDGNAPRWYMLNIEPTPCYPDYVLRGEITYQGKENFDVPFKPEAFGYHPRYRIWVNDQLRMTVLAFDPLQQNGPVLDLVDDSFFAAPVTAADFGDSFGPNPGEPAPEIRLESAPVLGEGSELKQNAPAEYLERAQQLQGRVALLGYDLDRRYASRGPGGVLPLTLYWQVHHLLSLRYKVFVHLISPAGQLWSQADDFPVCGTFHTNSWGVGQIVQDRHLLKLPPDMPPGEYTLIVGMYEPDLNLRLNYFDVAHNEQGNSLTIGRVFVE